MNHLFATTIATVTLASLLPSQEFSFVREHTPSFSNGSLYGHGSYLGDLTGDGVAEYGVAEFLAGARKGGTTASWLFRLPPKPIRCGPDRPMEAHYSEEFMEEMRKLEKEND